VASLVNFEDFLDPGYNFVGARVRWLVKVDDSVVFKNINRTLGR